MIQISEVRVTKINKGRFLGYASILIDNNFVVDGIELYEGEDGRYILMPLNSKTKKKRKNSAYPIKEEARKYILDKISEKYDEIN